MVASDLYPSAAGAITGLLVGLTGVGGGALLTPILMLGLGVPPLTAIGTDLWTAAITKSFAVRIHHGSGRIDWQVVRRLWAGSLVASIATLAWMKGKPIDAHSVVLLKVATGTAVLVTAVAMVFSKQLHEFGRRMRTTKAENFKALQLPLTVVAGVLLGVLVTLTSVGAGALGAVLLSYLYPLRLQPARLVATDIAHAIPLAIFAGVGHLVIGDVDYRLLALLLVGSIPGVLLGSILSTRLPSGALRHLLAAVLSIVAVKMVVSTLA